jgi:hypothetical protein
VTLSVTRQLFKVVSYRETLFGFAEKIPETWVGIRAAAFSLNVGGLEIHPVAEFFWNRATEEPVKDLSEVRAVT